MTAPAAGGRLALRLALFAALAAYAVTHSAALLADPPILGAAAAVLVATAGGLALARLGSARRSRAGVRVLALAVVLAVLAGELLVAGVPPRLLLPSGWPELATGLEHGLTLLDRLDWAYDGPDEWIRRTILLAGGLTLALAAAVTFWPARDHSVRSALGLTILVALYAVTVATDDPGAPVLRGLGLLALIAAWLWLPRIAVRDAALATGAVALAGALAVPVAVAADRDRPLIDYRAWTFFGADELVTFDWDHRYGPLDWPRTGTTILRVKSERPHYWKVETLSDFDGIRWERGSAAVAVDTSADYDAASSEQIAFRIRALATDVVVGAGMTYAVEGIAATPMADGSIALRGETLERGDSYRIRAWEPDPSTAELLTAPDDYPDELGTQTTLRLPLTVDDPDRPLPPTDIGPAGEATVTVPLRGSSDSTADGRGHVDDLLRRSAYAATYSLARQLTADSTSAYDAVKAIEGHLSEGYRYRELVPRRRYPLEAFLTEDRRGYCQHFSGAMALMLRMIGIPARVVAGFAPGAYDEDKGDYRVRDLDAHSWVEVYFSGIGWVPFDPTPSAAPPTSQANGDLTASAAAADAGEVRVEAGGADPAADVPADEQPGDEQAAEQEAAAGPLEEGGRGGGSAASAGQALIAAAGGLLAAALAWTLAVAARRGRRRRLGPDELADAQLAELRRALPRLGWELSPSTTLVALERRLGDRVGPAAAAYAAVLRASLYDAPPHAAPSFAARRALRRELGAGGPLARLRALLALPPGGPAPGSGSVAAAGLRQRLRRPHRRRVGAGAARARP